MNAIFRQLHFRLTSGTTVSTQIIRNLLHAVSLYARRSMVCVTLKTRQRGACRQWATEHVNWRRRE